MKLHLADINFLLPLLHPKDTHHGLVLAWLHRHPDAHIVLCRQVHLGLVRLLSNPKALGSNAPSALEALDLTLQLIDNVRFASIDEPPNLLPLWRSHLRHRVPTPKLVNDAYLAAFAIASGLPFLTFDKGFKQFRGLDLELLKAPTHPNS